MKTSKSAIVSGFALTFGLVCVAVGILMDPPDLTSEARASLVVDRAATRQQPAVKTQPIESLRVGDRVLAKNPEVSNAERASWGEEPDWSKWKKLTVEMPKKDGSTLHVEIIRPVEWLESQVGFVVAEQAEPVCHIGPGEVGRQKKEGSTTTEPKALASGVGANTLATNENASRQDGGERVGSLFPDTQTPDVDSATVNSSASVGSLIDREKDSRPSPHTEQLTGGTDCSPVCVPQAQEVTGESTEHPEPPVASRPRLQAIAATRGAVGQAVPDESQVAATKRQAQPDPTSRPATPPTLLHRRSNGRTRSGRDGSGWNWHRHRRDRLSRDPARRRSGHHGHVPPSAINRCAGRHLRR